MKKLKYVIALFFVTIFIVLVYLPKKYIIPQEILYELNYEANDFVEMYNTYPNYFDYTKVYENENGDLVFVLSKKEKQSFKQTMLSQLKSVEYSYTKKDVTLNYSDSLSKIQVHCKKEMFGNEISKKMIDSILGIAFFYNVFDDVKLDEIKVMIVVTDIESGEVVYEKMLEK